MIQNGSQLLVFITVLLSLVILEASYQVKARERSLVLQLTPDNFTKESKFREKVVLVIFFDPGHAYHKGLQPICEEVARVLEGVVPAAAVAMAHGAPLVRDLNERYEINKLPAIKVLLPEISCANYEGPTKAMPIIEFALQQIKVLLKKRIRRKSVTEFTSFESFDELVLKSEELWIVYFCYPRKYKSKFMNHELKLWKMVVSDLKDKKLMLGLVEYHPNTFLTTKFNVRPSTVMAFGANKDRPVVYEGGNNSSAITSFALEQFEKVMPPLEVRELTQHMVMEECMEAYFCFVAFLPNVSESESRFYVEMILSSAEKLKWKNYRYIWTSFGTQPNLDKLVKEPPSLIAINPRSRSYRTLLAAFDNNSINSFIRDVELLELVKPWKGTPVIIERGAEDEPCCQVKGEISRVLHLNSSSFSKVINHSKGVVLVAFFYHGDAHSRTLRYTWEKASRLLAGVVLVAAVDSSTHDSFTKEYGVNRFPTIKVFVSGKSSEDYQGDEEELAIAKFAFQQILKLLKDRIHEGKKSKITVFMPVVLSVLAVVGTIFAFYRGARTRVLNTLAQEKKGASKRKKGKKNK